MDVFIRVLFLALITLAVMVVAGLTTNVVLASRRHGGAINRRLGMIESGVSREETMLRLRRRAFSMGEGVPGPIRRWGDLLHRKLVQAGVTTPSVTMVTALMLAPIALFLVFAGLSYALGGGLAAGRIMLFAVLAMIIGALLPIVVINLIADRRRKKMAEQFPVALDIFVRGLRAGHPVAAALEMLTVEMPDPIGSEFGLVVDEVTYGADLREALEEMAERWDLDDLRMFVVSLSVQAETGGNLAEVLDNLAKVIRDRHALFMKVRALSSEGRMTAWILSVLPLFAFMIVFLGNPQFFLEVADDPAFVPSFGVLVLMWFIGVMMIRKLIDLKV
ncbi:type II secretion system F family protein [Sphingomicrobium astaxanthinifaciens]|uniref:type II secretion system F family protein n=1 Tax=Sphingomicrobium astaxanthinifaciens TaxID=1227949 RepID=UPI001FCB446D|nr:type II secretion system F family protein [Sphingomicrobium astaxanthinifaciens]MCJ7421288.1 type II secretion system F family protein [Sphingomicrobium astaxanthinifaciens]